MKDITGIYKHYKGKEYEVLGVSLHTETNEKLVLYKPLYDCNDLKEEFGSRPFFVRPYEMFFSDVKVDGRNVKRFEKVE